MYHSDQLNPMTHWKEQFEADTRDFKVENILWDPSEDELKWYIWKSISLLKDIAKTTYQNWRGSCCAAALSNVAIIQNTRDYWTLDVFAEREDLRTKMGHKLWDKTDSGDYLENALKAAMSDGIDWTVWNKNKTFAYDWYAWKATWTNDIDVLKMKYYIDKGYPLYIAFKWDSMVWKQMRVGNLERVITRWEATWWHALAVIWIVQVNWERYVQVVNSWKPISWEVSYFIMKLSDFKVAVRVDMVSWRYRITYDKKDIVNEKLFEDFYADENSEDYKAMKRMKDKWYYKWYNGKVFPEAPLTRKQFALVIYRMNTSQATIPTTEESSTVKNEPSKSKKKKKSR